jgi:predicted transcriptional regulator
MSPRRSSFQTAVEILRVIAEGEKKPTRIMYTANLSYNSLKSKLALLVDKDYVDEEYVSDRSREYSITSLGVEVLRYYKRIESLVQIAPEI